MEISPIYLENVNDKEHLRALKVAAKTEGWRLVQDATMRMLDGSCLYDLAYRSRSYENYIFGDDWEYSEVSFKARGQSGLGRLKKRLVHYSVMRVQLPRKLPNVVFDSLEHQRRQFRVVFDSKQYIQLEGNFNKYFATYFGNGYTIDDLSFITPEVMESLINAKNYDIEIVHNSLLLFGPIQSYPKVQIEDMSQAIKLIRKKLLNNILTYRDERLPYDEGRGVVARAGMFLEKQPIGALFVTILIGLLYLIPLTIVLLVLSALL